MASVIYNSFKSDTQKGLIDLSTDDIKVMLVTSTYVADIDAHTKRSDITNEVSGTGYVSGGKSLTGLSVTQNNTTDKGVFDADDLTWATSTITARGAVMYKNTGVAANDNLIAYIDFTSDKISTDGNFNINWDTAGIITLG